MAKSPRHPDGLERVLRSRRLDRFVGRTAEIEIFGQALERADPELSVLYITGPGGVGKSRLIEMLATRAEAAGAHVVRLVATAFLRVSGLVDPPGAMLRPRVAARVLRHRTSAGGSR